MFNIEYNDNFFVDLVEVVFDEQEGQVLQSSLCKYMHQNSLKKIVNTSFPDSYSSGGLNKYFYCFTVVQDDYIFYCYTLYQRIQDEQMSRNYNQKSVVLISKLCSIEFFKKFMLQYFEDLFSVNFRESFDAFQQFEGIKIQKLFDQMEKKGQVEFKVNDKKLQVNQKDSDIVCRILLGHSDFLINLNQQVFQSILNRN